jgi:hypothetical protein
LEGVAASLQLTLALLGGVVVPLELGLDVAGAPGEPVAEAGTDAVAAMLLLLLLLLRRRQRWRSGSDRLR